ncbi:malonate decarboxylase subunit epsilon [Acinetobacter guerrae]|uniref:Malonyl CoA-acyl carrier protein transacylase n=1 Tax=Acinetobacter guerrae TaxID=1843371 RepID=A0A3A8ELP7_9GAMM|nr:malonate decarboxylase subunit epsilon [Acinetobacter guerrae]RKG35802.1 malonate decarboxylase subunit epsilon [Acinetobacter guerrae]
MSSIWVYPGQGAQKINMLHDLPKHQLVNQYLEHASDVLETDVMLLDQGDALKSTYSVQLCLYLAGVISSSLLQTYGVRPKFVAGLSIGAWAAATVANVLSFEDGLRLVAKRGRLMQEAYPSGYGMTAILGTDRTQIERWITQIDENTNVFIANLNAENQVVISGSVQAMQKLVAIAHEGGATAKKIEISVPSHCVLLEKQAQQLACFMEGIQTKQPTIQYLSSTSARLLKTDTQIWDDLAFNMSRVVDWHNTVQAAWERGVRLQIEALPGTVLTGLARKVFKEGTLLSFQNTQIESLIIAMQKQEHFV